MVPELLKGIGGTNKRKIGDPPSLRKQGFSIVIVLVVVVVIVLVVVVGVVIVLDSSL
jgi:Tfp pilus assembly protein PilX